MASVPSSKFCVKSSFTVRQKRLIFSSQNVERRLRGVGPGTPVAQEEGGDAIAAAAGQQDRGGPVRGSLSVIVVVGR